VCLCGTHVADKAGHTRNEQIYFLLTSSTKTAMIAAIHLFSHCLFLFCQDVIYHTVFFGLGCRHPEIAVGISVPHIFNGLPEWVDMMA
jgi:hypothetical protein